MPWLALRPPPPPSDPPPDGFHYAAVVAEDRWAVAVGAASDERCRYMVGPGHRRCGRPAVARLRRPTWWAYCEQHLYGRWVEDGRIVGWRLVRDADGAS